MKLIQFSGEYGIVYKTYAPNDTSTPPWEDRDPLMQAEALLKDKARQQKLPITTRVDEFVETDSEGRIQTITQGVAVFTEEHKKAYDEEMKKARTFVALAFILPAFVTKAVLTGRQWLGMKPLDFDAADQELGESMERIRKMVQTSPITLENMLDPSGKLTFDLKTGQPLSKS